MLRCRTCKARFSERKGTPLFDSRLPPEKVDSVLEHVAEGCGVRQTGRLCRVNREHRRPLQPASPASTPATSTTNWSPLPPGPARSSSTRSGPSSPRRRRTATPTTRPTTARGTTGTTSRSTPSTGWSSASCPASGRPRTPRRWSRTSGAGPAGRLMDLMTTDDYPAYEAAILEAYGADGHAAPDRQAGPAPQGRTRCRPPGLTYATVQKTREKGRVVEVGTRVVFGTMAAVAAALAIRRRAGRSTRRSWSGRTGRTGTATPGRPARRTASRRTGGSRGGHLLHDVQLQLLLAGADAADQGRGRGTGGDGARRWRRA